MIYFLLNNDDLVYIGKTEDIKTRLNAHKANKLFDSYVLLDSSNDPVYEYYYINMYKPALNKRTNSVRLNILANKLKG